MKTDGEQAAAQYPRILDIASSSKEEICRVVERYKLNSSKLMSKLTRRTPPPLARLGLIWGELLSLSKPWSSHLKI